MRTENWLPHWIDFCLTFFEIVLENIAACLMLVSCSAYPSNGRQRHNVLPKLQWTSVELHGVIFQKILFSIITAVRTSASTSKIYSTHVEKGRRNFILIFAFLGNKAANSKFVYWQGIKLQFAALILSTSVNPTCTIPVSLRLQSEIRMVFWQKETV
jgi:hypothetical protein